MKGSRKLSYIAMFSLLYYRISSDKCDRSLDRLSVEFNDEAWFVVAAELSELWCFNFGDGGGANDNDDDDAAGDAVNFDDGEDV